MVNETGKIKDIFAHEKILNNGLSPARKKLTQ